MSKQLIRWAPLVIIIVLCALFFLTGLNKELTPTYLQQHLHLILGLCESHPILAPCILTLAYIVIIIIPTPLPALINMLAGFLFPLPIAVFISVLAETLGGAVLLKIVHTSLGHWLQERQSGRINNLTEKIQRNSWNYISILRLSIIFPSSLINIAAGVAQVPLKTYAMVTFISSLPAAFIYAYAGKSLATLIKPGQTVNFTSLFNTPTMITLILTILLIIAANLYQKYKK